MNFWEKCFQRTYQAFTTGNHPGRRHAIWWIEQAYERGLLRLNRLSPPSLCGIMRTAGQNSRLGLLARRFLRRTPSEEQDVLNFERRDNLIAIVGFWMDRDDPRHLLGLQGAEGCYSRDLIDFVTRYYWRSEQWAQRVVLESVRQAFYFWEPGRHTFETELLLQIRDQVGVVVNGELDPLDMQDSDPDWTTGIGADERSFLRLTRILDSFDRKVLLQTIYAGMLPREISLALLTGEERWRTKAVEMQLRGVWEQLFVVLGGDVAGQSH